MNALLPEGRLIHTPENAANFASVDALAEAMQRRTILETVVTRCGAGHDLHLQCGPLPGVIPRGELALEPPGKPVPRCAAMDRVGLPTAFVVQGLEANDGKLTCLLSRRRAQELVLARFSRMAPGTVIPATVTRLERFGAFVDVGCGLSSMIPISRISVSHIPHPACRFYPGQEIFALFTGMSEDGGRILLSHRELLGTWAENAAHFSPGETVTGRIRAIREYGVFVELRPNLTGLADPFPGAEVGQCVSVYIKSILPERHKLKLVILRPLPPADGSCTLEYCITGENMRNWDYYSPLMASQ